MNSKTCVVCRHPDRAEIERLLLSLNDATQCITLSSIAEDYGIEESQLRVHALMHSPLVLNFSIESEEAIGKAFEQKAGIKQEDDAKGSSDTDDIPKLSSRNRKRLADKVDVRESDMLLTAANEHLVMLKTLSRRLNRLAISNDKDDIRFERVINGPIVNLYLGASSELRASIDGLAKLNAMINGTEENGASGIVALAEALKMSVNPTGPTMTEKPESKEVTDG